MQKSDEGGRFEASPEQGRDQRAGTNLNFVEPPKMSGQVKQFKVEHQNGVERVFFVIELSYNCAEWSVKKRYNDFDELMTHLRFHFFNLPALPGKTVFALKKAKDIEERMVRLDEWVKIVLQRDEFFANEKFIQFFEVDQHAESKMLNKICLVGRLTHGAFGYRDVLIQENENIMFTLTSQMSTSTRIDSYITNSMGGRYSKNAKDHKMSISALECWIQKASGAEEFTYSQNWVVSFKTQAIVLYFCPVSQLLLVGCDNGEIAPIEVNTRQPDEYQQIKEYKAHSARVMGIWVDHEKNLIYSVGEDKKLAIFDMKQKAILSRKLDYLLSFKDYLRSGLPLKFCRNRNFEL